MRKISGLLLLAVSLSAISAFADKEEGKGERREERHQAMTECTKSIGLTAPEKGAKREFMSKLTEEQREALHTCMKDKGFAKFGRHGKGCKS